MSPFIDAAGFLVSKMIRMRIPKHSHHEGEPVGNGSEDFSSRLIDVP